MAPVQEGLVVTINLVVRVIKGAATDNMVLALAEAITAVTTIVEDGVVTTGTKDLGSPK